MTKRVFTAFFIPLFFLQSFVINFLSVACANSSLLSLPSASQMLALSKPLQPLMLQGLRYDPAKPFQFQFILQQGDHPLALNQLRDRGMDLARYFMAAMTIPAQDLWVNLSPYEKNRIIPGELGVTRLGSDMLVEDYILKQLSSSLTFPGSKLGNDFWQDIYAQTMARFGRTDVKVSTFNKVWIVPDYAQVFVKNNTVILIDSHLKVMMEQDYLAQKKRSIKQDNGQILASDVMRQVIIPVLEKEINTGSHFAPLRQIFHAVVLAEWYKRNLKENILNKYYANQHKVAGINDVDKMAKEAIYKQYLAAYKKGVYNFIREDAIPGTGRLIPRKYFSGGESFANTAMITVETTDLAALSILEQKNLKKENAYLIDVEVSTTGMAVPDDAMTSTKIPETAKEFIHSKDIHFLSEMRGRWSTQDNAPQDVKQLVEQLKYKTESTWSRWVDLETSFGTRKVLMVRVRHYGKITRGGVRAVYSWPDEDVQRLFQTLESFNPSIAEKRDLDERVAIQTATGLAMGMTQKNEAVELGIGGAKGLIYFPDSENLTIAQKEELKNTAFYWYGYYLTKDNMIGPDKDGLAPDMNSGADQMEIATEGHLAALVEKGDEDALEWKDAYWGLLDNEDRKNFVPPLPQEKRYQELFDQLTSIYRYKENLRKNHPEQYSFIDTPLKDAYDGYCKEYNLPRPADATFTGQSIKKGGIEGREEATGDGASEVGAYYYDLSGQAHNGKIASVQGTGNVGIYTALTLVAKGFNVRYINDLGITLRSGSKEGFSYRWLEDLKNLRKRNSLEELWQINRKFFEGVDRLDQDSILNSHGNIIYPAARQNVITEENWKEIMAPVIAEAANEAITNAAERELHDAGKVIIPDSLVNPGGVIVSKMEQVQSLLGRKLTLGYVQARMRETLRKTLKKYYDLREEMNKGVTNPKRKMTLRDVVKLGVMQGLAKKQMIGWINQNHGEINEIIKNKYDVAITDKQFEDRARELGLLQYLYRVQQKDLEAMRSRITEILISNIVGIDHLQLVQWLNLVLPIYDPNIQDERFKYTLTMARTFLRTIEGNGESLSSAAGRLNVMGYSLESTRDLRIRILKRLNGQRFPETAKSGTLSNRVYIYLRNRMIALDDAGDPVNLNKVYPMPHTDDSMVVLDPNGGIDFDASRMLINQKSESSFHSQALPSDNVKWQQIKGLRLIFLRLQPVNISALIGV